MGRRAFFLVGLLLIAGALPACGGGGPGVAPDITVSGTIVFAGRGSVGQVDIYVIEARGGKPQRLTDSPDQKLWPAWSSDGQRLAYVAIANPPEGATPNPEDRSNRRLMVINADGAGEKVIITSLFLPSSTGGFSWSPGGDRIAYMDLPDIASEPLTPIVTLVDVDTKTSTPLIEGRPGSYPAWSPDGTSLALILPVEESEEGGGREFDVFLIDSDGSNLRPLATRPGVDIGPVWSPDGRHIAWWGSLPGEEGNRIFVASVEDGTVVDLGRGSDPVWSPDGRRLLALDTLEPAPGRVEVRPNVDIYLIDIGSKKRTQLTDSPARDLWPTWSPDGQAIAFVSERDGLQGEIYLMSADGSDQARLTDNDLVEGMLAWSPR